MASLDELESEYPKIADYVHSLGLVLYPRRVVTDEGSMVVPWGAGGDWKAFLDLAPQIGATTVYVQPIALEEADLLENDEYEPGVPDESLTKHVGDFCIIALAYVSGCVVHRMVLQSTWWEASQNEEGAIVGPTSNAEYTRLAATAREGDWVHKIAEDPRFYGSKKRVDWDRATKEILGELGIEVDYSGPWGPTRQLAAWLRDWAASLIDEVRSEVEDKAMSEIPEMVEQLVAENSEWFTWRVNVREQKAKRLVSERYGWAIPVVVGEVARRHP